MNLNILKGILWDESHFPRIFQCSNSFPHVFPVFTWFSHDFPMFFQWVSNCFLTMIFFCMVFPMIFWCFHMFSHEIFLILPFLRTLPGTILKICLCDSRTARESQSCWRCWLFVSFSLSVYCLILFYNGQFEWTWMSWVKGLLNDMKSHEQTFDMKWDVMIDSDSAKKHQHSCLFNHVWSMLHHVLPRAHACKWLYRWWKWTGEMKPLPHSSWDPSTVQMNGIKHQWCDP